MQAIIKSLQKTTEEKNIHLEAPEIEERGDYATNVALILAKKEGENPRSLAEKIVEKLSKDKELTKIASKVEVAGPGFINFWLSEDYLKSNLQEILKKKESYGKNDTESSGKVMFEYGQPNTHKLPHIGHLFSYIYGESMTRLLEATGWEVRRVNYQGDVGLHVAKCLWAFKKNSPKIPEKLSEKAALLQKMYQEGSKEYEEDENAKKEIQEINKKIYQKDPSIKDLWQKTRSWSVNYYKEFEKRLGINFDRHYFEGEVQEKGKEKVLSNTPDVFKESEGAIIFEGSKYGLHDRVFITSDGNPTYEAKDFYLEDLKFKEWPMDLLVITTAHEQNEYFKVVFKALETVHPEMKGKLKHIGFGMVSLKSGKMSSRTGEIIGGIELVDTVVGKVKKITKEGKAVKGKEVDKVAETVGLGAVKYSFLKNNPLQDTKFDIEESIAAEGNSGPYLQYTVARCNSVVEKGKGSEYKDPATLEIEETLILRSLSRFSGIIIDATKSYSPNTLANYLYDLAQKFNSFYNKHKIIGGENEAFRLSLTKATAQVLSNGLNLLGIEVPERM